MLKQYKKNLICMSLFMAMVAVGCSSEKQTFEGRLKYEKAACNRSDGIFHADSMIGGSICECCLEKEDGSKICKPGSEIDCYQSWVCDAANYACKKCNEGDAKCENGNFKICVYGEWKDEIIRNNECTDFVDLNLCTTSDCIVSKNDVNTNAPSSTEEPIKEPEDLRCECIDNKVKCGRSFIYECKESCQNGRCSLETINDDEACDFTKGSSRCGVHATKEGVFQQICQNKRWEIISQCEDGCSVDARTCGCEVGSIKCASDKVLKCNTLGKWEELGECSEGCKDDKSCNCPSKCPDSCDATGRCIDNCNNKCSNGCNEDGSCKCPDTCPNTCGADGKCIDNKCSNGYEVDGSCKCQNCVDEQVCNPGTGDCVDCLENDYMCKSGKIFRCDNNNWNQHNTIQCPNDECKKDGERVQYQKDDNEKNDNVKIELCAAVNANKCADSLGKITILEPEIFPSENLDQCKVCVSEYEASINVKDPTGVDYPKDLMCGNLFEYLNDRNINWTFNSENYIEGCYSFNLDVENKSILVEESGEKQYNGNVDECEFNMDLICSIKMENNYRCYTSTDPGATAPNSIVQQCSGANWTSVFENENRPVLYFHNSTYIEDGKSVDSIHVFSCYYDERFDVDTNITSSMSTFLNKVVQCNDDCKEVSNFTIVMKGGIITKSGDTVCFDDVYNLDNLGETKYGHSILLNTKIGGVPNCTVTVSYCPPNYKCNSTHTDCVKE